MTVSPAHSHPFGRIRSANHVADSRRFRAQHRRMTKEKALVRQWRDRARRFESSGKTVRVFCEGEGVKEDAFYKWRRRLKSLDADATIGTSAERPVKFLEVATKQDATVELVTRSGLTIRVRSGFDEDALGRVLDLLEHRG